MSDFFDMSTFIDLATRFGIDLIGVIILVRSIYFTSKKEREFVFTFYLFNIIIFFVAYLMMSAEISMGFAFGLFAIFGILRYRTDTIPIKEMTYLLATIAMALVNTIGDLNFVVIFINISILASTWVMEKLWFGDHMESKVILYEDIALTHEGKKAELIDDLRGRTGLDISRVYIKSLNYLNDSAEIKIYYKSSNQ